MPSLITAYQHKMGNSPGLSRVKLLRRTSRKPGFKQIIFASFFTSTVCAVLLYYDTIQASQSVWKNSSLLGGYGWSLTPSGKI